ncbi:MAG: hypothetical protein WEB59_02965 [Thermoanaerobaculia bacterium]
MTAADIAATLNRHRGEGRRQTVLPPDPELAKTLDENGGPIELSLRKKHAHPTR